MDNPLASAKVRDQVLAVRESRHRHSGIPPVHGDSGLHDHFASWGDRDADPAHHPAAIWVCGVFLRLQRRRVGISCGRLRRSLRPQALAAVLLFWIHAGHVAVRFGHDLPAPIDGAHRYRFVWRGDRLGRICHYHGPFSPANARPGDGGDFHRICREPGARAPRRVSISPTVGIGTHHFCHHCRRCCRPAS